MAPPEKAVHRYFKFKKADNHILIDGCLALPNADWKKFACITVHYMQDKTGRIALLGLVAANWAYSTKIVYFFN